MPGITAILPGYMPGHIALAVESDGATFVDLVDTVLAAAAHRSAGLT